MKHKNDALTDPYLTEKTGDLRTCSSTDCTGLIPSLPQDEFELESYEAMYPFLTPPQKDERPVMTQNTDSTFSDGEKQTDSL